MNKYVAYMRVSTQRQKNSGLGLESQRYIIQHFAKVNNAEIVQEFVEAQSGKKESINRPLLNEAIQLCKREKYTLIVAKVDRLSRNVKDTFFIVEELENRLIACDIPQYPIDTMILAVFSAFAQQEAQLISLRTKRALDAKKARGEIIIRRPHPNILEFQRKARIAIQQYMKEYYTDEIIVSLVERCVRQKLTLQESANLLNKNQLKTRRGKRFNKLSVLRLKQNVKKFYLS